MIFFGGYIPIFSGLFHYGTIFTKLKQLLKVSPCQVTFDEFYKMMTTPAPPLPPPVNSNKKKPYSDKLGGAKRRVAVSFCLR